MAFSASDLIQTMMSYFRIGGPTGVRLKNSSGNLLVRNPGDSADAEVTASKVSVSGNDLVLNSDAAESTTDWKATLRRNTAGTESIVLVLPPGKSTDGYVLRQKSGTGAGVIELEFAAAASTSACLTVDTTTLAYNASSPVTLFTLPANAVVEAVRVVVDTAFNATGPSVTVGVSGTTSKYMGATDNDLTAAGVYEVRPGVAAGGSTEALIATFAAGSGGSAGSARIEVDYAIPQ